MILSLCLQQLESSDLVRPLQESDVAVDVSAFWIKHALVQETVHASMLKQERRRLHRLVALALESLYADRLDENAALLLQHYDAAGMDEKTLEYAERAGNVAFSLSAYAEAIAAYTRALELAQQSGSTAQWIRVMTQLGRAHELDANYDAALQVYRQTQALAREKGDRALELAALLQLAKVLAVAAMRYDPEQAQQVAEEALTLARDLRDEHAQAQVLWTMMLLNMYGAGGARKGVVYGEQSLALARALNWREQMAYTLNDLVYTYMNLGAAEQAHTSSLEARALWRELDNKPMLTDNLAAGGMDELLRGESDAALALVREARTLSQSIGNRWGECTSYMIEGFVYSVRGNFVDAQTALRTCIAVGDPIGVRGPILMSRYELALLYGYLGDTKRSRAFATEALDSTRAYTLGWNAWAFAVMAQVEWACGDLEAAERATREIEDAPPEYFFERILPFGAVSVVLAQTHLNMQHGEWAAAQARLEQLLTRMEASAYQILLPDTLNMFARVLIAQQKMELARRTLVQVRSLADTLHLRAVQFEVALTQMDLDASEEIGTVDAKPALRALDALLETIPSDLRASFMNTERVQRVLSYA